MKVSLSTRCLLCAMGDGSTTPCHSGPPACPHCPVPRPGLWRGGHRGSTKRKFLYAKFKSDKYPRLAVPLFCPTLGPCTTSCSVLYQRRHHMSASGQRAPGAISLRRSGALQRALTALPATGRLRAAARPGGATRSSSPAWKAGCRKHWTTSNRSQPHFAEHAIVKRITGGMSPVIRPSRP